MSSNTIEMPIGDVMKDVTVTLTVTGARRLAFRMWLAGKIIAIAAYVGGFESIEMVDNTE